MPLEALDKRLDYIHKDLKEDIGSNHAFVLEELRAIKTVVGVDHDKITKHESELGVLKKVSGAFLVAILTLAVAVARWGLGILG